ncbi:MAG: hypothetical protein CBE20_04845 [Gammaproteobacteria bacterium TMED260]|nr:hypothetical protein [Gammaproteobacteria bacterium]OUX33546.1 MAG: hypothetical protein CBE20_04845 [Gammaproteobacteria bacterium TMED260]
MIRELYLDPSADQRILAVIQRSYDENQTNVLAFQKLLIQFYSIALILSVLVVIYLSRSMTNLISSLAEAVKRIGEGNYDESVRTKSRDELGQLADSVNTMASGLQEKERVRDLLGKVVSQEIAEELLSNSVELSGEERTATILFSDIRGFTSYCEDLPPQKVLGELNKVLSCISDIVEAHNGVVDKFQGDAVMALFGAPVSSKNDAANAMAACLEIISAVGSAENPLSACVGINTGLVVAGNLGSANRLNYSVIGDAVNLVARLESLTRLYNVANIVSAASMSAAPGFVYRELDEVQVVSKNRSVSIYELVGAADTVTPVKQEELALFASALAAYRQQDWLRAREQFTQLLETCDNTALHRVFLQRIEHYEDNPPGPDWQGVYTFDKK